MSSAGEILHGKHRLREGELGTEKYCNKCSEWWPADTEFFYADGGDPTGLYHCCKACYEEYSSASRRRRRPAKAAA